MKTTDILLWRLILLCFTVLLFFGFHQKGYSSENRTFWYEGDGLQFLNPSFVYSSNDTGEKDVNKFNLKTTVTIKKQEQPYFARMLTLIPLEKPYKQFLIGQWDHSLVIMNGTDYGNFRKEPKIYLPIDIDGKPVTISIQVSPEVTEVYIDNTLFRRYDSMSFTIPAQSILVLGDMKYRSLGWEGTYHSLSLQTGSEKKVWASYDFTKNHGLIIPDTSGSNNPLQNPDQRPELILHPFERPTISWWFLLNNRIDIFLNWIGFIPFTFLLTIGLARKKIPNGIIGILSTAAAFSLSLIIETYQIWIPTRNSSLLDLFLNTTGGGTGFLFAYPFLRYRYRHQRD